MAGSITAKGRGLIKPSITVRVGDDAITVRVDDERRPTYWFEIEVPRSIVREWAGPGEPVPPLPEIPEPLPEIEVPDAPMWDDSEDK